MKKTTAFAIESFRCYWNGKQQPVGSFTKESVKQYILNDINSGRATISQFRVISTICEYPVSEFINA